MRGRLRQCRIEAGSGKRFGRCGASITHTRLRRAVTQTTLGARSRSCARTDQVCSKNKYSLLDKRGSTNSGNSKKWLRGQVKPSIGAPGDGSSSNTGRRATFRRAPVPRLGPPPSAVTSARRSFLGDGKTYVTLLQTGKLSAHPSGEVGLLFPLPSLRACPSLQKQSAGFLLPKTT